MTEQLIRERERLFGKKTSGTKSSATSVYKPPLKKSSRRRYYIVQDKEGHRTKVHCTMEEINSAYEFILAAIASLRICIVELEVKLKIKPRTISPAMNDKAPRLIPIKQQLQEEEEDVNSIL